MNTRVHFTSGICVLLRTDSLRIGALQKIDLAIKKSVIRRDLLHLNLQHALLRYYTNN